MNGIALDKIILLFVTVIGVVFVSFWFARHKNRGGKMVQKKYNKDGSINQQWLAEEITRREGKLKEVDIGQVKEVLRVALDILHELYDENPDKVQEIISKR